MKTAKDPSALFPEFKNGQYNHKESWNKELDELAKLHPDKLEEINSMRDYDDEKVELARTFMKLMGGK